MEMRLRTCCGQSQCTLASVNSSFFVFSLAKKIRQRPCSPIWRGRIFQTESGGYFPAGQSAKIDRALVRAVWVLLDFIQRADYHAPADFPVKLVFFADGELYEVACVEDGQEALVCHALRGNKGDSRRIILVDSPAQIAKIDCPGISGFCTVEENGQTHYFKKAGGT